MTAADSSLDTGAIAPGSAVPNGPDRLRGLYARFGKRAFDIGFALLIAPVAIIAICLVAFAMSAIADRGPLFFGHRRVGRGGKVFRCWKIRTMVVDAEARLHVHLRNNPQAAAEWARDHKLTDDPRVTALGHILRRTSLDELPQIWNVLRGDMSFVGPRPIVRSELHKYKDQRATYISVRPGVTGLWQVSGRNDISYNERVRLDADYVRDITLGTDAILVLRTAWSVLGRTGK